MPIESLTENKAETPESSIKKSKKMLIIGIVNRLRVAARDGYCHPKAQPPKAVIRTAIAAN